MEILKRFLKRAGATQQKDKNEVALAKAYRSVINDKDSDHKVAFVNREDKLDQTLQDVAGKDQAGNQITTGAQLDDISGGGKSKPFNECSSLSVIVLNSESIVTDYKNLVTGETEIHSSSIAERTAHESLGHGVGTFLDQGMLNAIQSTNLYLRAQGANYFRTGETHYLLNSDKAKAQEIPWYLNQ